MVTSRTTSSKKPAKGTTEKKPAAKKTAPATASTKKTTAGKSATTKTAATTKKAATQTTTAKKPAVKTAAKTGAAATSARKTVSAKIEKNPIVVSTDAKSKPKSINIQKPAVSPEERYQMIAMAAYLRAERRNFATGGALDDWIAAEAEVDARLNS